YVDSFSAAIPSGLNALWYKNVGWPTAVPEQPFHRYVLHNQWTTDYYYSAYPMAASNDVKAAKRIKDALGAFIEKTKGATAGVFGARYQRLVKDLQNDISLMDAAPIVSLATAAIAARRQRDAVAAGTSVQAVEVTAGGPTPSHPKPESNRQRDQING